MAELTFGKYQELATRTAHKQEDEEINYVMGLDGESGELIDGLKKHIYHGHDIDKDYIKKEAGDVLWYTSQLARLFKIDLSDAFDKFKQVKELYDGSNQIQTLKICSLEITTAVGLASAFLYQRINGNNLHVFNLEKQLISILTDLFIILIIVGLEVEEVAQANVDKLMARYPEGFSQERSINREEE